MTEIGTVITVYRGACEVVHDDRVLEIRLTGRHAEEELQLAVGDEVSFDAERRVLDERLPRRTKLARLRPRGGRRQYDPRNEQVIAAKPTAALDGEWGDGFLNPERFVRMVYISLKKK